MNASLPIEVTDDGIVIEVSPVQLLNAELPIEVTLDGIVIEVSAVQLMNAVFSILFTGNPLYVDGITNAPEIEVLVFLTE